MSRPHLHFDERGEPIYEEMLNPHPQAALKFVSEFFSKPQNVSAIPTTESYRESLERLATQAGDFAELTVLMTGASPDSIAVEVLRQLIRGNARVVVTTTSANAKRMKFYRDLYNRDAGPLAQLHVLPFNQASMQDVQQLVNWLFESEADLRPNLILPFGAMKSSGSLVDLNPKSEAAMRAMLTGLESLSHKSDTN